VLDIGCGWGANLEYLSSRAASARPTASPSRRPSSRSSCAQAPRRRRCGCTDYKDFEPEEKYDALISIEMIDHLCSPAQANQGMAIEIYREYFRKCAGG
jgi:cyclopropane-fatty-acyl-phospholipid synthase